VKIDDEYWPAKALAALAPYLTGELLQQGLDAALKIASLVQMPWQA
jgi:hypothetical protein